MTHQLEQFGPRKDILAHCDIYVHYPEMTDLRRTKNKWPRVSINGLVHDTESSKRYRRD